MDTVIRNKRFKKQMVFQAKKRKIKKLCARLRFLIYFLLGTSKTVASVTALIFPP